MVQITLNGVSKQVQSNSTIKTLLDDMELPKFFVVEKNLSIIYKEQYESTILEDGDIIEVAVFCGGG